MKTEKPKLIIIAGPNGSGKTSVTGKILEHHWIDGCFYINPDNIAQNEFGDWNSQEAIYKAANKAKDLREDLINKKEGILFETVFSAEEKLTFLKHSKESGYFIRLFFVGTNHPAINASRIAHRVLEGGHDVPITKIISRFSKSIVNCGIAASLVDRLYVYDNSEDFAEPKLLFKASHGILTKEYNAINPWALSIYDSLRKK